MAGLRGKRRATRHRAGLLTGADVPVIYIPCLGSMWDEVDRVRQISETEGLVALGVDSVGYAIGSKWRCEGGRACPHVHAGGR